MEPSRNGAADARRVVRRPLSPVPGACARQHARQHDVGDGPL